MMSGLPWGGSEQLWCKTANLASDQSHIIFVSVYNWGLDTNESITALKQKGAFIQLRERYKPNENSAVKIFKSLKRKLRFSNPWKALFQFRPDHILINQGGSFDALQHHPDLIRLLQKRNINYSILSHSHPQFSYIPETKIYEKGAAFFSQAQKCYFVSHRHQEVVEKAILEKLGNASITANPLNLESFMAIPWPIEITVNFAMVGGLISGKGYDLALEVFAGGPWKSRPWHLNIYGDGPGRDYLERLVSFYKLEDRITLHGHVRSASDIWKLNHILLLPSSGEGMPISIVEAMISGRPVIATDVGGICELVLEGNTGFIAEGPGIRSVSGAMERAWQLKDSWKQLGMNGFQLAQAVVTEKPEVIMLSKITSKNG
jgi:glycosyltransferase involved in cell wall biosynthesis